MVQGKRFLISGLQFQIPVLKTDRAEAFPQTITNNLLIIVGAQQPPNSALRTPNSELLQLELSDFAK